jgi:hypothetical protein
MSERYTGKRRFVDGKTRLVFEDGCGQFVLDDDGQPVYGTWILPPEDLPDEPIISESMR